MFIGVTDPAFLSVPLAPESLHRLKAEAAARGETVQEVVEAMAGQSIQDFYPKEHFAPGSVVLKAENLSDGKKFFDINFEVHEGEVYGIAGLLGAGQTQLARSIYGLNRLQTGSIVLNGDPYHSPTPKRSISMGLGMITEDRKTEGLVQRMSIRENAALSPFAPIRGAMGVIRTAKERMLATESVRNYSIKCESIQQEVLLLSGGNQQKVVLARALAPMPKVVIMCEPTRGVDVNGKVEIYRIINELLRQRKAVILVSSEIPEVLGMSDRIAVMYAGRLVELSTVREMFNDPKHPYSQALISSLPNLDNKGVFQGIPGLAPSLLRLPSGCAFHPRCPYGQRELQRSVRPEPRILPGGRMVTCHLYDDEGHIHE